MTACRNVYKLIRARVGDELSDREIARRLDMEWKSFAALKHGRREVPRVDDLERIAKMIDVETSVVVDVALGRKPKLPRAEARSPLRATIDRVSHPAFTVDLGGALHDVNPAMCAAAGRRATDLVGQSIFDLVTPETTSHALTLIAGITRGEIAVHAEVTLNKSGDALVTLEVDATPIRDGDGKVIGGQAVCRDVSAERQFAHQIGQRRQLLQTVFDRMPAACVMYGANRIIIAANPLIERVCDKTAAEIVGRAQSDVFGAPAPSCPVTRAFLTGQVEQQISWMTNRSGHRVYVHRVAGPVCESGQVERVVEILVDVTEQVRSGDLRLISFWHGHHEAHRPGALPAERRRMPRTEVAFNAQLRCGDRTEVVHVENLGPGGLFVRTDTKIAKGTEIELQWLLPMDRAPVRANGIVAWIRAARREQRAGIGVRFLQIAPAADEPRSSDAV